MTANDTLDRLDDLRRSRSILEHPSYVAWTAGELTRPQPRRESEAVGCRVDDGASDAVVLRAADAALDAYWALLDQLCAETGLAPADQW